MRQKRKKVLLLLFNLNVTDALFIFRSHLFQPVTEALLFKFENVVDSVVEELDEIVILENVPRPFKLLVLASLIK